MRAPWCCASRSCSVRRDGSRKDTGQDTGQETGQETGMRLNPPSLIIFLISVTLAALALVTKLGFIPIPRYVPHQEFWLAITAYMTLMIGNIARGL